MSSFAYGTLFSGGGLADFALDAVGGVGKWGIEIETAIAEHYKLNHPTHKIYNCGVQDINPEELEAVDALHLSPPCQQASIANNKGVECENTLAMGDACCRVIESLHKRGLKYITLENVWGYRHFESFKRILATLRNLGYIVGYQKLNAADFGTPQNRQRLWLRAVLPEYCNCGYQSDLFGSSELDPMMGKSQHLGWYEALEPILDDLPDCKLADWQIERLPDRIKDSILVEGKNAAKPPTNRIGSRPSTTVVADPRLKAVLVDGTPKNWGSFGNPTVTTKTDIEPCLTIRASQYKKTLKAILIERDGANKTSRPRADIEASPTVRALGGSHHCHQFDAITGYQVKRLTANALWILQMYGCKSEYRWLPKASNVAQCRIIGNGVAYLCARAVVESLLEKRN